jgi:hypothetical protein
MDPLLLISDFYKYAYPVIRILAFSDKFSVKEIIRLLLHVYLKYIVVYKRSLRRLSENIHKSKTPFFA